MGRRPGGRGGARQRKRDVLTGRGTLANWISEPGEERRAVATLALGFVASFLAVGWPYWQIPYAQVSLPNSLYTWGLVVVFVTAAACRYAGASRFFVAVAVVGSAAPAAVMARVVHDTAADPTSHNLWPFEVVFSGAVGWAVAAAGALAGGMMVRFLRRELV